MPVDGYKVAESTLIVTKPSGEVLQRPVRLFYNGKLDTLGIVLLGDSPLKGYSFEILQREFRRARDAGTPMTELPKVM
jgi:hypothetical protein